MANFDLLSALGTLGAGFSAYGQEKQRKDALSRALEEQQFERGRLMAQDRLAKETAEFNRQRQNERDALDAILGGLRPQGGASPLTIGGRTFDAPSILTPEEKIADLARLWQTAYPNLSPAQVQLLARGGKLPGPGDMLIDPGTQYNRPTGTGTGGRTGTGRTTTAIVPKTGTPSPTMFGQRKAAGFGQGSAAGFGTLDTRGIGAPWQTPPTSGLRPTGQSGARIGFVDSTRVAAPSRTLAMPAAQSPVSAGPRKSLREQYRDLFNRQVELSAGELADPGSPEYAQYGRMALERVRIQAEMDALAKRIQRGER